MTFGSRFLEQGWRLHQTLVWVKDSLVVGHSDYHYRHEPVLFGYKAAAGAKGERGWRLVRRQRLLIRVRGRAAQGLA